MTFRKRIGVGVAALAFALAPLAAQGTPESGFTIRAFGGGYNHVVNLDAAGTAHFKMGYVLGANVGYQFNRYFSVNGDFSFARNQGKGVGPLVGVDVNRFFYGAQLLARYPFANGTTPYIFAGGGGLTVDESGAAMPRFTKPAGIGGIGLGYMVPSTGVELTAETKGMLYKWDRNGFNKAQLDATFMLGIGYHF